MVREAKSSNPRPGLNRPSRYVSNQDPIIAQAEVADQKRIVRTVRFRVGFSYSVQSLRGRRRSHPHMLAAAFDEVGGSSDISQPVAHIQEIAERELR
jgi:hypothetical protein